MAAGSTGCDDVLNGLRGADSLSGGLGNDTYFIDQAADAVLDLAGQGASDRLFTEVSYTLAAYAEIEQMQAASGAHALALTGNGFAQMLIGGRFADTLTGGGGNGTLREGEGADVFVSRRASGATRSATSRRVRRGRM